jgi:hypothetical protein
MINDHVVSFFYCIHSSIWTTNSYLSYVTNVGTGANRGCAYPEVDFVEREYSF